MANYQVSLLPGDGIGTEVAEATRKVLDATGVGIDWDVCAAGLDAFESEGELLPQATLDSIRKNGIGLKGPITTPIGTGFRSVNVALRQELDLYANLRPGRSMVGVQSQFDNIDLVIVRENTEDTYAGVEFDTGTPEAAELIAEMNKRSKKQIKPEAALSIKMITPEGSRRIVKFAFEYAKANNRKLVTAVHKANIMKFTDGLFLKIAQEVAQDYPEIEFNDRIVDNMCMQLMQKPDLYDVLVMPNLYGDIVSDLVSGMIGGLGVAPGGNIGTEAAVFEPIHGSAPTHAGKGVANPVAMILSGAMMLRHMNEQDAAERVEKAVAAVIEKGEKVTYDLRKDRDQAKAAKTMEMAEAIVAEL